MEMILGRKELVMGSSTISNVSCITIDLDWAIDSEIFYMLDILSSYDIRSTIFCTHLIDFSNFKEHELAIHPNFLFQYKKSDGDILKSIMKLYPDAVGVRSHCLYRHSRLLPMFKESGIMYESNYFIPYKVVEPFFLDNGILEIPIYFGDDSKIQTNVEPEGFKVYMFHPSNVFKNYNGAYDKLCSTLDNLKNKNISILTMKEVSDECNKGYR